MISNAVMVASLFLRPFLYNTTVRIADIADITVAITTRIVVCDTYDGRHERRQRHPGQVHGECRREDPRW